MDKTMIKSFVFIIVIIITGIILTLIIIKGDRNKDNFNNGLDTNIEKNWKEILIKHLKTENYYLYGEEESYLNQPEISYYEGNVKCGLSNEFNFDQKYYAELFGCMENNIIKYQQTTKFYWNDMSFFYEVIDYSQNITMRAYLSNEGNYSCSGFGCNNNEANIKIVIQQVKNDFLNTLNKLNIDINKINN